MIGESSSISGSFTCFIGSAKIARCSVVIFMWPFKQSQKERMLKLNIDTMDID